MLSIDKPADEAKSEDLMKVTIGDDPKKFFQIGSQLSQQEREELIEFLKQNVDVFLEYLRGPRSRSKIHLSSFKY